MTISGLELIQNAGREQMIDLLAGRVQVAEARLRNAISAGLYGDGTGNGGKDITGLQAAISSTRTPAPMATSIVARGHFGATR